MKMMSMGYHHRHVNEFQVDHSNGFTVWLLLIVKSAAVFVIDGVEHCIKPNTVIMFRSDSRYSYYPAEAVYYDDWIQFLPEEDGCELFDALHLRTDVPYTFSVTEDLSQHIRKMCGEFYSESPFRFNITVLMFQILLFRIAEKLANITIKSETLSELQMIGSIGAPLSRLPTEIRRVQAIAEIHDEIFRWADRKWTVDEMAERTGLSRSRFQHLYREIYGQSVSADIAESRINYAKRLLSETSLSVRDIAFKVGYSGYTNFVRKFTEIVGCSPRDYRNQSK